MKAKPEVGSYVERHGLVAQVIQHYTDTNDVVKVLLFPQAGYSGSFYNAHQNWQWQYKDVIAVKRDRSKPNIMKFVRV